MVSCSWLLIWWITKPVVIIVTMFCQTTVAVLLEYRLFSYNRRSWFFCGSFIGTVDIFTWKNDCKIFPEEFYGKFIIISCVPITYNFSQHTFNQPISVVHTIFVPNHNSRKYLQTLFHCITPHFFYLYSFTSFTTISF